MKGIRVPCKKQCMTRQLKIGMQDAQSRVWCLIASIWLCKPSILPGQFHTLLQKKILLYSVFRLYSPALCKIWNGEEHVQSTQEMSLGAAWWKPALPSCPCWQQSCSREGAKNAFQGRISVSAFTQLSLNSLGTSPWKILHSGQPLWLLLLRLVPECPGTAVACSPTRAAQLLAGRRTKPQTGRAQFCSTVYLKHSSPHGLPGDTNNPLVAAHHPRKSLLGTQQVTSSHFGVHEALVSVSIGSKHTYLVCAWFPSGFLGFSCSILRQACNLCDFSDTHFTQSSGVQLSQGTAHATCLSRFYLR